MRAFTSEERAALVRGDRSAWGRVCEEVAVRVELQARLRMGAQLSNRVASEDLAQEVLLQLSSSGIDPGSDGQGLSAWIRKAVEHVVVDHYRKHVGAESRTVEREEGLAEPTAHAASSSSPTHIARRRERAEALWRALATMPKADREVLVHRFLEGRSVQETAGLLGKSVGAVAVQQHRALCRLRETYAGAEPTGG